MHQTLGEDYVVIGGNRLFQEAQPPTVRGTRVPASSLNALQMEICNVITLNGGSLEPDGSTDQANGWHQLYDIIFEASRIGTNALASSAVTNAKLATGAVSTAKILDGAVSNAKIFNGAVSNSKLADGAVSEAKIAPNSITNEKMADGAVGESELINGSVTRNKMGMDAVARENMYFPDGWSRSKRRQVSSSSASGIISSLTIPISQVYPGASMLYRISINAILFAGSGGYARIYLKDQDGVQLFDTTTGRPILSVDLLNGSLASGYIQASTSFSDVLEIAKGTIEEIQVWADYLDGSTSSGSLRISLAVEEIMNGFKDVT